MGSGGLPSKRLLLPPLLLRGGLALLGGGLALLGGGLALLDGGGRRRPSGDGCGLPPEPAALLVWLGGSPVPPPAGGGCSTLRLRGAGGERMPLRPPLLLYTGLQLPSTTCSGPPATSSSRAVYSPAAAAALPLAHSRLLFAARSSRLPEELMHSRAGPEPSSASWGDQTWAPAWSSSSEALGWVSLRTYWPWGLRSCTGAGVGPENMQETSVLRLLVIWRSQPCELPPVLLPPLLLLLLLLVPLLQVCCPKPSSTTSCPSFWSL